MVSNISVVSVKLVRESNFEYKIINPNSVYNLLDAMLKDKPQENFLVVSLSSKGDVLNVSTVAIGILNSTIVHSREVFRLPILSNADSIVLAHNHPSGDCTPSKGDIEVTKNLVKASKIMGIPIQDHMIIGRGDYFSFKEKGLM